MNERIKQLALQALKHPDNDNDGLTVFDNDELEKFAELIVRECAELANEETSLPYNSYSEKIRKHFGVEGVLLK
jgi:hypothetical protein